MMKLALKLITLMAFFMHTPLASTHAEMVDKILVVVNDEIITNSDLEQVMAPIEARLRATMDEASMQERLEAVRKSLLGKLVDDRLVISEARAMQIVVKESEVDEMVADMRANFPTDDVFENVIREQGLTHKRLRDRFRDDILKRKILDFKIRSRINASPGEIRKFYEEHQEEFQDKPQARVRQILLRTGSARMEDDAQAVAHSLHYQIKNGGDMAELAAEYSDASDSKRGGDMGWIKRGQFLKRLDTAIFSLDVGEISEPIKTKLGYHIFKVEDYKAAEIRDFEDVRNAVRDALYRLRMDELVQKWLSELRDDAYISYQG